MILLLLQLVLVAVVLLVLHYLIFVWNPNYFKKMGVSGPFPWPLVGYMRQALKKGFIQSDIDLQKYGRVIGVFEGTTPVLLLRDPEMIQQVAVKNFHAFTNRRGFTTDEKLIDLQVTVLKDDHWRHVRHLMIPAFTAAKLKAMIGEINRCAQLMTTNIEKAIEVTPNINLKEYAGAFTMDVIAKTAFGIEVDSQQNKDNPFVTHAHKSLSQNFRPAVLLYLFFPIFRPLLKMFGTSIFPLDSTAFFRDVINRIIDGRIEDRSGAVDFIQLMMNAHKERQRQEADDTGSSNDTSASHNASWADKGLTREEIEAQAFLFFLAGYDTTASTVAFFLYNMALNPDCQQRLFDELDEAFGSSNMIEYDKVNDNLAYLDRCVQETLRVFPPTIRIDRVASEDVTISGMKIPKSQIVGIEIYALHHDPTLWPNPDKFDPERFTKEARQSHHPYQYMPFGAGPRICIGQRLALLEVKIAAASLIRHFRFSTCEQTDVPMKFQTGGLLQPQSVFLRVEKRS